MIESIFLLGVIVVAIVLVPAGVISWMLLLGGATLPRRQEDRWAYRLGRFVARRYRRLGTG